MPPRRKKLVADSNHTQEQKGYTEAGNRILAINPDSLIILQNQSNPSLDNLQDDQYSFAVTRLVNIIDFLNDTVSLISTCPFHKPEEIRKYIDHIQALANLGDLLKKGSIGTSEYLGNFNEVWGAIRDIAHNFDFNLFHETFSGSRSTVSSILRHVVQMAHEDPHTEPRIFELFKSVTATRKRLATRLSVLVSGRKIRTVITLWEKLIETQNEVLQFFKATGLMTPEMMTTVNNCFNLMFDSALHLKNLLVIQQLANAIDRYLAHPTRSEATSSDDEDNIVETDPSFENEVGRAVTDELVFEVRSSTKFLKSYNDFIKEVKPNQPREAFLEKFKAFLAESQNYEYFDLYPTLFSLFYNFRKLYFESLPIIIIAETDTTAKSIRQVYLELQVLLNSFKSIIGKEIDMDAIRELLFPTIEKVRQACQQADFEQIKNILSCLDLICNELQTINDTLCVTFQTDQFINKLKDDDLSPFNFDCSFYEPPNVSKDYEPDKERNKEVIHNFDSIIETFVNRLETLGFHVNVELDYSSPTSSNIEVPLLAETFKVFQDNLNYSSLYNLMMGPANESDFFSYIFETQKEAMVISSDKSIIDNLAIICQLYYLLMALDAANLIDFSNSLHLTYMRSYFRLYYDDDRVGSLMKGLNSSFDYHQIFGLEELECELKDNEEILKINQEVSNVRVLFYSFMEAVSHLPPSVLFENIDPIGAIIAWFVNPINSFSESLSSERFSDLLSKLQQANISEIHPYVEKLSQLYDHIITYRQGTPIITYLTFFIHIQPPDELIYKPLAIILIDAIEKCMNFGILNCDLTILEKLKQHENDQDSIFALCKELRRTMITSHEILLKKISIATLNLTTSGPLNSSCDLLIRGSLICRSVKLFVTNLIIYQNQNEADSEKIDLLWQYITQISQFIIFIATFDVLLKPSKFSMMRQMNFTQYISFFSNLMLYLTYSMNLEDEKQVKEIALLTNEVKSIISRSKLTVEMDPDTIKDVILIYSNLRLKYNLFNPEPLIRNCSNLIDHFNFSSELKNLFDISLKHIESSTDTEKSQELLDHLHDMILQLLDSYRKNDAMYKSFFDTCSLILDIFTTLIMYYSGIRDSDSFFIAFSTNKSIFQFQSPLYIEPLSVLKISNPPLIPHQSMCSSTNRAFQNLSTDVIEKQATKAIENISDLVSSTLEQAIPPTFVLPIEAQQSMLNEFISTKENYESSQIKQKSQFNEIKETEDKSKLMELIKYKKEIERLENESLKLKSRIDILNETTENLYDEFVVKQNEQFNDLTKLHEKEMEVIESATVRENELIRCNKESSHELRHKRNMLKQIEEENENLKTANQILQQAIERKLPMKTSFDNLCEITQRNIDKQNETQEEEESENEKANEEEKDDQVEEIETNEDTSAPLSPTSKSNLIENLKLVKPEQIFVTSGPHQDEDISIPDSLRSIVDTRFATLRIEDNEIIQKTISMNYEKGNRSLKGENDEDDDIDKNGNCTQSFSSEYSQQDLKRLKEKYEMIQRRKKVSQELVQEQLKKITANSKD